MSTIRLRTAYGPGIQAMARPPRIYFERNQRPGVCSPRGGGGPHPPRCRGSHRRRSQRLAARARDQRRLHSGVGKGKGRSIRWLDILYFGERLAPNAIIDPAETRRSAHCELGPRTLPQRNLTEGELGTCRHGQTRPSTARFLHKSIHIRRHTAAAKVARPWAASTVTTKGRCEGSLATAPRDYHGMAVEHET